MKQWVEKARRPEVVGGIGGFAGLFDASALKSYRRPLLATSADGVGTKVAIAQAMDVHDTIGFDLVGMLVDDLVVCGAEPLFLTDYIACGRSCPSASPTSSRASRRPAPSPAPRCSAARRPSIPACSTPDEYDVAGSTTGVVEADALLGAELVREGDVVVAMASSGLHSNGYSLVRHVLLEQAGWSLDRDVPELGRTPRRAELLTPTRLYTKPLPRSRRAHRGARDVARHRWRAGRQPRPGACPTTSRCGSTAPRGRVPRCSRWSPTSAAWRKPTWSRRSTSAWAWSRSSPRTSADDAVRLLAEHGVDAWIAGDVAAAGVHGPGGSVTLTGDHA